mgnify:FL=1
MRALGLFGGTFDPIHFGHLRLAQELAQRLKLGEVKFIPSGLPPHRKPPHASVPHRIAMVQLAITGNVLFSCDPRETLIPGPSYSVDTLRQLREELGNDIALCFLLGSDAFLGLNNWHEWQALFDLTHLIIAQRPGARLEPKLLPKNLAEELVKRRHHDLGFLHSNAGAIYEFEMTPLDISASRIRADLNNDISPRYLTPDAVIDYVTRHRLYKDTVHAA